MQKKARLLKSIATFSLLFSPILQAKERWILIHGTFANKTADVIKRTGWWKERHPFYQELNNTIPKNAFIEPFEWCGSNSHERRIVAAKQLAEFITTSFDSTDKIHIIGHSHGANIGILTAKELANLNSKHTIDQLITLGVPVSEFYALTPSHIKKVYNLFSFGDFVQPVISLFERVFPEEEYVHNIQIKIDSTCPSHIGLHHPLIARHITSLHTLIPNNKPHCISFFSDKDPIVTLDANREQDLRIDKSFTTQLINSFAESKKRGYNKLAQVSKDTKTRLLRLWHRRSFDSQSMSES
jgi:hypothetical protein